MKPQKLPLELMRDWLRARIEPDSFAWLEAQSSLLVAGAPDRTIFLTFSKAVRFTGRDSLNLTTKDLADANSAAPGWNPKDWNCDHAGRILLLLSLPADLKSAQVIHQIYQTADVGEATALQKALAVLANPVNHVAWAREGIRSNIQEVFEAISVRNPYPSRYFDDIGWNQLVTKTFFVGIPLHLVDGIDVRVNLALSRMLVDLAYERWAAGREFSPELWRCVGKYADNRGLDGLKNALQKAVEKNNTIEKRAAALGLSACTLKPAATLLAMFPDLSAVIANGKLTWETLYHDT